MKLPGPDDYIDIHNHGSKPAPGCFTIENLMAHEGRIPDIQEGIAFSAGIHPWHLTREMYNDHIRWVGSLAGNENVIALGEAGYDKLRGPGISLQKEAFEAQAAMASRYSKPLFIHCVRSWDELFASHKRLKPSKPWLIHGFRGKKDLALQLLGRGMYISFWFDYITRQESSELVRNLPAERIFLETDGSGEDIKKIYKKVADDLGVNINNLKEQIFLNFKTLFL